MIETWALINTLLTGYATLTDALGHTAETPKIFRGNQYKLIKNQDHIVLFSTEEFALTPATSSIRNTTIYIVVLSRVSDADAESISEILLNYLDRKRVLDEDLNVHGDIFWDNFKTPAGWDEEDKCWSIDMRFKIPVSLK